MPFLGFGDRELHPTFHQKAAAYCSAIVRYHPLVDGNKRAGYLTMLESILRNGRSWSHGPGGQAETATVVEMLAAHAITEEQFEDWVRRGIHEG